MQNYKEAFSKLQDAIELNQEVILAVSTEVEDEHRAIMEEKKITEQAESEEKRQHGTEGNIYIDGK